MKWDDILSTLLAHADVPATDELLVNGPGALFAVRAGIQVQLPSPFPDRRALALFVHDLARAHGVRLDPLCGSAGGQILGGAWRWHCVLPPLAPDGPLLSLRRHRFAALGVASFGGTPELKARLAALMTARRSLIIAGPTGSGKTTLLAALLAEHARHERVVLVEALAELPLPSAAAVRLLERRPNLEGVGAVPLARLVQEALRLRPDRLVVGELRGGEGAAFAAALASGHGGALTTIHAQSVKDVGLRLAQLADTPLIDGSSVAVCVVARGTPPRLVELVEGP